MKYIILSLLLITASAAFQKNKVKLNERVMCEIQCAERQLPCLAVVDKIIYDGNTEEAKIISKQTYSVCLEEPVEFNPT